jgi:hypothetical protein
VVAQLFGGGYIGFWTSLGMKISSDRSHEGDLHLLSSPRQTQFVTLPENENKTCYFFTPEVEK